MVKYILSVLICFFTLHTVSAQKKELLVRKDDNNLYLDHKVVAKETFYSVGRLYNLNPKTIASFNKLNMDKGLNIDQKIKIPLNDSNFTQQDDNGTPVYYKVKENDGLLKVSNAHKNVPLKNLRKWNNIQGDIIAEGSKLIIGFLVTKESIASADPQKKPVEKIEEKPEVKIPVEEKKPEEKTEPTKPEPVVIKEEPKIVTADPGFFKSFFEKQVKISPLTKNETVTSGIFKTTSGWQDGKYYLLIDKVPPGTIIKVVNPANNLFIFAKVLGEMSGIRQNEGLNIRISNAGASVLQVNEQDKFIVKVVY